MATKMIRQNNIAFIVFVVLVIITLCSCESIAPDLMPEAKEQNEIHIMTKNTVVQTVIGGVYRTIGDSTSIRLQVIQLRPGDYVQMEKVYGDSVSVTVYRKYVYQELGWVSGLFFKF